VREGFRLGKSCAAGCWAVERDCLRGDCLRWVKVGKRGMMSRCSHL
jgi:hypothetical protein